MSHPTWVRGLKPLKDKLNGTRRRSHPTWVRGLKLKKVRQFRKIQKVAPYVGAWIETSSRPGSAVLPICRTLRGCVD